MKPAIALVLLPSMVFAQFGWMNRHEYFVPSTTLSGVGAGRSDISDTVLARRTELMVDSQTFSILRDPHALEGAQRVTGPRLKRLFEDASRRSGLPARFIAAVAYLESWGVANEESPSGPKGMMQIAQGTARAMGLQIVYATRYRLVKETVTVKRKGKKPTTVVRTKKVPYTVLVRDERLIPEKAVPAAAQYLARLEQRYGGRDWAVWAYHCGEGCASEVRGIAQRSDGMKEPITVPKVFFAAHPARNRELYTAISHHMERDFSPTYFFRITRAEELLKLYEEDPESFRKLWSEYRNRINPDQRAPHRLFVWLKPDDLAYKTCEDMRTDSGRKLVRALDDPNWLGFTLGRAIGEDDPLNREFYLQASQSAIGTIAYIAYETRRLHDAMKPKKEPFVPLEVLSLVRPLEVEERTLDPKSDVPSHCSGQVFDLNYANLPPAEREALQFVLEDMGWYGYLGFIRESSTSGSYHVGAAPTARDFFSRVYQEAVDKRKLSD